MVSYIVFLTVELQELILICPRAERSTTMDFLGLRLNRWLGRERVKVRGIHPRSGSEDTLPPAERSTSSKDSKDASTIETESSTTSSVVPLVLEGHSIGHPKTEQGIKTHLLVACVTAYNESREELQYCLSTFHGRCTPDVKVGTLYVVLDGCPHATDQESNQTFLSLVALMNLEVLSEEDVLKENGCRVYLGTVGLIKARLYVKGPGPFQRSKRKSIAAFYEILEDRIAAGVADVPAAVMHLDGDTGAVETGRPESGFGLQNVAKLYRIMHNEPNIGAVASQVRVLYRRRNLLTLMQSFDCNTTYVGVFGGSSLVGRSIACFGMAVMYRYRALKFSRVVGVPSPLAAFSRDPTQALVDLVNLDMNEDQGMTTFVLQAGYDTKVSMITRFYTFAPETLAELFGQRRRWQAGYFVGMPAQVFASPWPHLQIKRMRWMMALVVMSMWLNAFTLPGLVAVGLAFLASSGVREVGYQGSTSGEMNEDWVLLESAIAAGVWLFWIVFTLGAIDRTPKKIRRWLTFFIVVACTMSVMCCLLTAVVTLNGKLFVALIVALNLGAGLMLTFDLREWLHRLEEVFCYIMFLYAIQPMITMYAVANIDSNLWGTRSVGMVNAGSLLWMNSSSSLNNRKVAPMSGSSEEDEEIASAAGMLREVGRGPKLAAVRDGNRLEEGVRGKAKGDFRGQGVMSGIPLVGEGEMLDDWEEQGDLVCERRRFCEEFQYDSLGNIKTENLGEYSIWGKMREVVEAAVLMRNWSLRSRKYVILILWLVLNISVTVIFLRWRIELLVLINFFSNFMGLFTIVVAAGLEFIRQRGVGDLVIRHIDTD